MKGYALRARHLSHANGKGTRPDHLIVAVLCLMSLLIAITLLTHGTDSSVLLLGGAAQPKRDAATPVSKPSSIKVSQALVRIDQSSPAQYASRDEHERWWQSTCSTASMTEVFNAYGQHLRITDVLQVEKSIGAIRPDLGLLYPAGIDETARHFGFNTSTLSNPTVS